MTTPSAIDLCALERALVEVNRASISLTAYRPKSSSRRQSELVAERARLVREIRIAKLKLAAKRGRKQAK